MTKKYWKFEQGSAGFKKARLGLTREGLGMGSNKKNKRADEI